MVYTEQGEEPPLPDGIVAVEYIKSTGTQYIDTGILLRLSDIVDVKFSFENRNSVFGIFSSGGFGFNLTGGSGRTLLRYAGGAWYTPTAINVIYSAEIGDGYFYLDNTLIATVTYADEESLRSCTLFARVGNVGTYSPSDFLIGQIYGFSVKRNGDFLCNMIPVRFVNETDGMEGGMYDLARDELFRNKGKGNFEIGPDL